jgi:hypothetical protein
MILAYSKILSKNCQQNLIWMYPSYQMWRGPKLLDKLKGDFEVKATEK